jgi:hypothetical protein
MQEFCQFHGMPKALINAKDWSREKIFNHQLLLETLDTYFENLEERPWGLVALWSMTLV